MIVYRMPNWFLMKYRNYLLRLDVDIWERKIDDILVDCRLLVPKGITLPMFVREYTIKSSENPEKFYKQ